MKKTTSGFTIVELLIVIVVIAILAAISIVAYNGIQTRAHESRTFSAVNSYVKLLSAYKAINGDYPSQNQVGLVCLGRDYDDGVCHTGTDGTTAQGNVWEPFNAELESIGTLVEFDKEVFKRSNGQVFKGASFQYSKKLLRYFLAGRGSECKAGGAATNYQAQPGENDFTYCMITMP